MKYDFCRRAVPFPLHRQLDASRVNDTIWWRKMETAISRKERIAIVIGGLLATIGVLCNEWVLAWLLSPDGDLHVPTRITIWIFNLFMVGTGTLLIYFGKRHQLLNLVVLFLTLLLSFSGAEIALRLIQPKLEKVTILEERPNGVGSYKLKPNANLTINPGSTEIVVKTNSYGMRWRDVSAENPLKKTRVAFVGDSFTFGLWADSIDKSFVGVFDSIMNSEVFEVLNFGVPGYGLADIELQIKKDVLVFKPDYIILMFYNGNDFKDTYLGKNKYKIVDGVAIWDKANENKKIPFEHRTSINIILSRSALYSLFKSFITAHGATTENSDLSRSFRPSKLFGSETFWSRKNYPEVAVKAKKKTLVVLNDLRKLAKKNNIQFLIATIPFHAQIHAKSKSGKNYNIALPQKYIEEYSKAYSLPYLDLLPVMRAFVRKEKKQIGYPNDIHFNNIGHYVIGTTIAEFFKESMLDQQQSDVRPAKPEA